jgi:GWxTD domain-containing protein
MRDEDPDCKGSGSNSAPIKVFFGKYGTRVRQAPYFTGGRAGRQAEPPPFISMYPWMLGAGHNSRQEPARRDVTVRFLSAIASGTLVVMLSVPLTAQSPRLAEAESLFRIALEQTRDGDTTAALKTLERANKVAPTYAPAFYQRGLILGRGTRLGMSDVLRRRVAFQMINRALDLDNDNPFYLMELGRIRLKTPFLRLDAERLFNRALSAAQRRNDPVVLAEVHWELGQIHERRYVTMAQRRMITGASGTFSADEALANWQYTLNFLNESTQKLDDAGEIDYRQTEDHYRAALAADPRHAGAAIGLLALLYDGERYEEMAELAKELRKTQPTEPRVALALGLALHRLDRDAVAQFVFDTALTLLPADERRDMAGLENILQKEAASAYGQMSGADRSSTDSLYWDVADPLKITEVNEARMEFLARVAYADLRFTAAEFRTRGWQTDRGIIYIRYGDPPVKATFAPQTAEIEGSDALGKVTYVWWYPDTKMRFVFVGPPAMNYASFASDFRAYAENARFVSPIRFDNLKPLLRVDSVPVQVARFRGDSGAVDVSIFADIPSNAMLREVDVARTTMETALFLSDARRRPVVTVRDSASVRGGRGDRVTPRAWRRSLRPGEYLYRVEAREQASGRSARGLSSFNVEPYPKGQFALSDVLVAQRIVPRAGIEPRGRSDFLIVPNAAMTFVPRDTVFLYWELYGTTADSGGNGHLKIDLSLNVTALDRGKGLETKILGGIVDAVGLSAKGDDRVSLHYNRSIAIDPSDRIPNYLALDLGDAPYGTYTLELTVTDLVSGRSATRQRVLTVPRR